VADPFQTIICPFVSAIGVPLLKSNPA